MNVHVVCESTGQSIANALVVALTSVASGSGVEAETDQNGLANLQLPLGVDNIEMLYVYPERDFWSRYRKGVKVSLKQKIGLKRLNLADNDVMRHCFRCEDLSSGKGVRIGVIDSGIDSSHPDLQIAGGLNTVPGEHDTAYDDNGISHGTHVAGIIGSRGRQPSGIMGIAPAAEILSYRVCGANQRNSSSYSVAAAIDAAANDECDVINISMSTSSRDSMIEYAIEDAAERGVLTIAAAGNAGVNFVHFPACLPSVVGISAMGRKRMFPKTSTESLDVTNILGSDKADFFARFSNSGSDITATCPGVAVISTVPGGYASMSGTSMSTPIISGIVAKLLSVNPTVQIMPRNRNRAIAIRNLLLSFCRSKGFSVEQEGRGFPQLP